jgi:hypothetical protein
MSRVYLRVRSATNGVEQLVEQPALAGPATQHIDPTHLVPVGIADGAIRFTSWCEPPRKYPATRADGVRTGAPTGAVTDAPPGQRRALLRSPTSLRGRNSMGVCGNDPSKDST